MNKSISKINPQIIGIVILSLFAHATLSGGRVISSLFVLQNGYSEMMAGLTYGLYGLMPALLSLHMGKWIDRVGSRFVMRFSLLVIVIGLILPAIDLSITSVLICASFSGFGFGGYILSAQTSIAYMKVDQESDRTGMFAWLQMGTSISAVTGPALVGLMLDSNGFSTVYLSLSAIVFIGFIGSFCFPIPSKKSGYSVEKNTTENKETKKTGVVKEVMKNKSLMKIYLLSMAVYFAWDCFAFLIPVLGVKLGYSSTDIGLILSFFAAGTLIIRALMPWISRRISEFKILAISFGIAAMVFFLLPFVDSVLLTSVLSLFFGLLAGVWHPNIQMLILAKVGKSRAGEASGLRLMTGNLSGMLGTTACGAILALAGVFPVFWGIAAIIGLSSWQAARKDDGESLP